MIFSLPLISPLAMHRRLISVMACLVALVGWVVVLAVTPVQGETAAPTTDTLDLTWTFSTLESTGDVGSHLSMALQPGSTRPHIAYYSAEEGLKLATYVGEQGNCGANNTWECTVLHERAEGQTVGRFPSLAFRSDGSYAVAYQHHSGSESRSMFFDSLQETPPALVAQGLLLRHNALVFDQSNQPHLWYHSITGINFSDNTLAYKTHTAPPSALGASCSAPVICRHWMANHVVTTIGVNRDFIGNPAVSYIHYSDLGDTTFPTLSYAERRITGSGGNCWHGEWDCTRIGILSFSYDRSQANLGMALYQRRCFMGALCHLPTSIAYYSPEHAHIRLVEKIDGTANRCNEDTAWQCTVLERPGVSPTGWQGDSLRRWPMGLDFVVYQNRLLLFYQDFNDPLSAKVKMAYKADTLGTGSCFNQDWHCVVVDDGVRGGGFVSVGFGLQAEVLSDGRILLAYYDLSHKDLILAETIAPPPLPIPPAVTDIYLPLVIR